MVKKSKSSVSYKKLIRKKFEAIAMYLEFFQIDAEIKEFALESLIKKITLIKEAKNYKELKNNLIKNTIYEKFIYYHNKSLQQPLTDEEYSEYKKIYKKIFPDKYSKAFNLK